MALFLINNSCYKEQQTDNSQDLKTNFNMHTSKFIIDIIMAVILNHDFPSLFFLTFLSATLKPFCTNPFVTWHASCSEPFLVTSLGPVALLGQF